MAFNCLIVDDEKPARELIRTYVAKIPELSLIGMCENPIEAKSYLTRYEIDILFLDIRMPELSGVDFLKMLSKPPATIFITAYDHFALEGYNLDVVDYLLKPVEFNRFFKAVSKAMDSLKQPQLASPIKEEHVQAESKKDFIFVKADKEILKINITDILFIESEREYVHITTRKEKILTLQSLSRFNEILPQNQFFRVHRSFIVNIRAIESIMGNTIFIGKHSIPISRGQRQPFLDLINQDNLF